MLNPSLDIISLMAYLTSSSLVGLKLLNFSINLFISSSFLTFLKSLKCSLILPISMPANSGILFTAVSFMLARSLAMSSFGVFSSIINLFTTIHLPYLAVKLI
ncbi:102aa long hypothetical protein [Pyrococcus horikoshii OT3]|uniref:Uncharacterized protein n=1 Tax=Pyrococcus horikoshii (strain ATCC 700860 / DSM 12428 / JCM 9974 / NBRC 100139 / OT-3) TaxID=70601 RepID=O57800_PYRHO|nr:102aa long hypothetical protein [Pyrococcus horikoshii OT3]